MNSPPDLKVVSLHSVVARRSGDSVEQILGDAVGQIRSSGKIKKFMLVALDDSDEGYETTLMMSGMSMADVAALASVVQSIAVRSLTGES